MAASFMKLAIWDSGDVFFMVVMDTGTDSVRCSLCSWRNLPVFMWENRDGKIYVLHQVFVMTGLGFES